MKDRAVAIYKTNAIGKTEFIFTSSHADPLKPEIRGRRFVVCDGRKTGNHIVRGANDILAIVVPNDKVSGGGTPSA